MIEYHNLLLEYQNNYIDRKNTSNLINLIAELISSDKNMIFKLIKKNISKSSNNPILFMRKLEKSLKEI